MKLLVIYGPPASGKLTVANELARLTNFKNFHNHKTIDVFKDILEFGSKEFWDRVRELRIEMIELATNKNINLIFTLCYTSGDEWYIDEFKKLAKKYKSELYFVRLDCSKEELLKRVGEKSRRKFGKIVSKEELVKVLNENDFFLKVRHNNLLEIDNSHMKPSEAAKDIKKHFNL